MEFKTGCADAWKLSLPSFAGCLTGRFFLLLKILGICLKSFLLVSLRRPGHRVKSTCCWFLWCRTASGKGARRAEGSRPFQSGALRPGDFSHNPNPRGDFRAFFGPAARQTPFPKVIRHWLKSAPGLLGKPLMQTEAQRCGDKPEVLRGLAILQAISFDKGKKQNSAAQHLFCNHFQLLPDYDCLEIV